MIGWVGGRTGSSGVSVFRRGHGEPPGVGVVLHSSKLDGAGLALLELFDALPANVARAIVFAPRRGPLCNELEARRLPYEIVPYRWWMDRGTPAAKRGARSAWNVAMALPLALRLRRRNVDLVYTSTLNVVTGALAARLLNLPHVWHVHELWGAGSGFTFDLGVRRSLGLVDRLSSTCVAVSHAVAASLRVGVAEEKITVVYQAVSGPDPDGAVAERPPTTLVCLVLGAVFPVKRQEDAVGAVAALAGRGIAVELWLVGEEHGGYGGFLRARAAAGGVADRVRFWGFQRNPWPLLKAADLVLSCCAAEPFGRATVEGMLAGKPIVAARGGGNEELVSEGFNGLFYRGRDEIDLAAKIERLMHRPEERRRLGENGQAWAVASFGRARYGAQMAELLAAAVGSGRAVAGGGSDRQGCDRRP
jgi:glycosyltransferase involved in cell wall biosynthesis